MSNLMLRQIDSVTMSWLRTRAQQHRRSMNTELLTILRTVRTDELALAHADNAFAKSYLKAKALGIGTESSATEIVRADRRRKPKK